MRGGAPNTNLLIQIRQLELPISFIHDSIFSRHGSMSNICNIKIAALVICGITGEVVQVGSGRVIVRSPFVEMVCNVVGCWIWARILEINDNYLARIVNDKK
jgi:hypothetical protein